MMATQRSGLLFILLTIVFTVAGQLLLKAGMSRIGRAPGEIGALAGFVLRAFLDPLVLLGFASAFAASVCWMGAVSRCALSVAYPFMGLAIVLVMAVTPAVFGERVQLNQWLGVALVCLGLWVAARSA